MKKKEPVKMLENNTPKEEKRGIFFLLLILLRDDQRLTVSQTIGVINQKLRILKKFLSDRKSRGRF